MSNRKFEILDKKTVYKNPWIRVEEMAIMRDGEPGTYGVVHPKDVAVLIVRNRKNQLLMVEQYRFPIDSIGWEIPMGSVEQGELPLEAAKRELMEETGVKSEDMQQIATFRPVPGLTTQTAHLFKAVVDDDEVSDNLPPNDEILSVKFIPDEEVRQMVKNGLIFEGITLGSLALENLAN